MSFLVPKTIEKVTNYFNIEKLESLWIDNLFTLGAESYSVVFSISNENKVRRKTNVKSF